MPIGDKKPTDIKDYAKDAAVRAGLNPTLIKDLIRCESEWRLDAKGDNGSSHGLLQFKVPTFELFSKKYGLDHYDIENPYNQVDLAALMIQDGYIYHWKNCGRKLGLIK
jgi:soluble lytic murein transglycosylase-like protein